MKICIYQNKTLSLQCQKEIDNISKTNKILNIWEQ